MSEQAHRAHDDAQLLARIDKAATQAGLGRHVAAYPGVQPSRQKLGCMVIAAVALAVAAAAFAGGGYPAVSIIALAPLAVVLYALVQHLVAAAKNEGGRLDLFEHGLTSVFQGRLRVYRYDATTVLQDIVRHTRHGAHMYTTYRYTLTDTAGESVVLREGYVMPTEWGPAIQQGVTTAQLPRAAAALNAGERLDFGDIWMSRDEVGSGSKSVRWREIQEIRVQDGFVTLKVAGKWRGLTTTAVRRIPNFFVFRTLADQLQRA